MVTEVKILQRITYNLLAVVFSRLYRVGEPCPFRQTLLKGPLARSKSNLDSTTCTIVKIKTCI